eukprot:gene33561-40600_t
MDQAAPVSILSSMDQIETSMGVPRVESSDSGAIAASGAQAAPSDFANKAAAVVTPAKPSFTPQPSSAQSVQPQAPEEEVDTEDEFDNSRATISCDRMRNKITNFLATKEMNQTEFLNEIGVNPGSFHRFMKLKGAWNNLENSTYWGAQRFFGLRELRQKKALVAAKKAEKDAQKAAKQAEKAALKTSASGKKRSHGEMAASSAVPVTPASASTPRTTPAPVPASSHPTTSALPPSHPSLSFHVPDAIFNATTPLVPLSAERSAVTARGKELVSLVQQTPLSDSGVYDDCDEIRRKIAVITQSNCISKGDFYDAIGVQAAQISKFLAKKGANEGAGGNVYPHAYEFFEKLRLALGKPKTAKRKSNEAKNPHGFPLENARRFMWVIMPK